MSDTSDGPIAAMVTPRYSKSWAWRMLLWFTRRPWSAGSFSRRRDAVFPVATEKVCPVRPSHLPQNRNALFAFIDLITWSRRSSAKPFFGSEGSKCPSRSSLITVNRRSATMLNNVGDPPSVGASLGQAHIYFAHDLVCISLGIHPGRLQYQRHQGCLRIRCYSSWRLITHSIFNVLSILSYAPF